MELKMKMYDTTITWEDPHDDWTSDEMLDMFTKVMLAFGFHPESVRRSVIELAEEYKDESLCNK